MSPGPNPPSKAEARRSRLPRTPTEASPHLIVFALWLLVFASSSQTMIISPILPRIGEELGVADALLGTLVSAYSLMVGTFAIISGPISDRVGRRRILLLGTGIMTLALVLHAFVVDYASFLGVRVVAGLAGGVLSGSAVSYIGDYFPYNRRGWATGWVMSGSAFGQIFGIPLGVMLAGSWGFRSPFLLFALMMGMTFVLVFLRVPQPQVRRSRTLSVGSALGTYGRMLKKVEVTAASAAYFLMFLGVSLYVVYLPTWLETSRGITPFQIAGLFLIGGVANVLTGPQARETLRPHWTQGHGRHVVCRPVHRHDGDHRGRAGRLVRLHPLLRVHDARGDADQPLFSAADSPGARSQAGGH